jgi:DNA-binding XRE family transcriptional regulator
MGTSRAKRLLTDADVLKLVRAEITKAGSQKAWAKASGISRQTINQVINGKRAFEPKVLLALGLKKVNAYSRL